MLKAQGNHISDFSSLKDLKNLRVLWINDNKIKDYTQFEDFKEISDFVYK